MERLSIMKSLFADSKTNHIKLVYTLVDHILATEDNPAQWRHQLIESCIYNTEQAAQLSDDQLAMIYRAILIAKYVKYSYDELIPEFEHYQVRYRIDLDDEYTAGAVAY